MNGHVEICDAVWYTASADPFVECEPVFFLCWVPCIHHEGFVAKRRQCCGDELNAVRLCAAHHLI